MKKLFLFALALAMTANVLAQFNPQTTPLTLEARDANTQVKVLNNNGGTFSYQINGTGAMQTIANAAEVTIDLPNVGDYVQLWGDQVTTYKNGQNSHIGIESGFAYIYGNVMSLVQNGASDFANLTGLQGEYAFYSLFSHTSALDIHPTKDLVLPATLLTKYCYKAMFLGCTGLTKAPALPAEELARYCYDSMFLGCVNLTQAPLLPALYLSVGCYDNMFYDCQNLSRIECYAIDLYPDGLRATENWVVNVSSSGTFVSASVSVWSRGNNYIPIGWSSVKVELPQLATKYTITWKNYNDTVLAVTQVAQGQAPVYPYGTPYRAEDEAGWEYKFNNWTPFLNLVYGDATYTAQYIKTRKKYHVRFLDEDLTTVLYETEVEYGDKPQYGGAIPTKDPEACCNHPFVRWEPEIAGFTGVTQDTDFVAVYGSELRQYTVTFQIDEDNVLQSGLWDYGVTPTYNGEEPSQEGKQFMGWSPEISQVQGDAVYTAVFNETYQVTLADCEHGSIAVAETGIDLNAVVAGTVLHFNALPDEGYELDAWSGCNADGSLTVMANTTVSASFKKQTFVVTLVAEHGHINVENEGIDLNAVEYGTALNLTPVPDEGYYFSHWHATACGADFINSNTTITAYFNIRTFQVIFVDYDNREISSQTVNYGEAAVAPADPEREGYRFIGWDQDFSSVTANMTIMAQYEQLPTGFESVFSGEQATKLLRNGQIFILRGEKTYTLTGQEVR